MFNQSYKITAIILFLVFLSIGTSGRLNERELRHKFLILSAGDIKYYDRQESAKKRLIKEGDRAVRFAIRYIGRKSPRKARAIEWIAVGVGEDAVQPLNYVLANPDEDNAAYAAYLLGKIGSKSATVPLMLAAKSHSEKVRSSAIGALGSCGDTAAVPMLIEALSDSLPSVRRKAAHSLGELEDERAIKVLMPLLADSCGYVRYAASYAVSKIGGDDASGYLIERLQSDSLEDIERYHIVETLGLLKAEDSLPILMEFLEDPFYLNRGFACQALGHFRGNYEVANALKRSLHDASGFVRMMADQALEAIRNE
ncbi:hypothetical protein DRQ36_02880 [bacterium]|nr:MAG: hypothetical protein DRQ36_02880 [bacterium]